MDKGEGGNQQRWIEKFLNVNIINFAKVDKGGGGKIAYPPNMDNLPLFLETFPYYLLFINIIYFNSWCILLQVLILLLVSNTLAAGLSLCVFAKEYKHRCNYSYIPHQGFSIVHMSN